MAVSSPSFSQGFARSAGESAHPDSWKGLTGLWVPQLGPTGTTIYDLSGHANHGTLIDMDPATDWIVGANGYGIACGGGNDYVGMPTAQIHNYPFTMLAWGSAVNTTELHVLMCSSQTSSGDRQAALTLSGDVGGDPARLWVRNGVFTQSNSQTAYIANTIHCVVGVATSATERLVYLDGVAGTVDTADSPFLSPFIYDETGFGALNDTSKSFTQATVYIAALWNRALPANEIHDLYINPLGLLELRKRRIVYSIAAPSGNPWYHYAQAS